MTAMNDREVLAQAIIFAIVMAQRCACNCTATQMPGYNRTSCCRYTVAGYQRCIRCRCHSQDGFLERSSTLDRWSASGLENSNASRGWTERPGHLVQSVARSRYPLHVPNIPHQPHPLLSTSTHSKPHNGCRQSHLLDPMRADSLSSAVRHERRLTNRRQPPSKPATAAIRRTTQPRGPPSLGLSPSPSPRTRGGRLRRAPAD